MVPAKKTNIAHHPVDNCIFAAQFKNKHSIIDQYLIQKMHRHIPRSSTDPIAISINRHFLNGLCNRAARRSTTVRQ